ncbi:oxygenase MpaB family protein [Lentzea sp. NPDC051838]|uniref:oxygenase MpaB family protein n=1 Tax=Lentzea sp. NPDC051838 TaxID=3154849 RepID=UPI003440AA3D
MGRFDRLGEIQRLDPEADHGLIHNLVTHYEFPWDYRVGFQLAVMTDIVVPSISRLLQRTGQFTGHGQKRFDDTMLFEYELKRTGLDSPHGRETVRALNKIHGRYEIPNEDYRYLLASQTLGPIRWINAYGWRPLSTVEERALILTGRRMGELMGIKDIPPDREGFEEVLHSEQEARGGYDPANREIASAVFDVIASWMPPGLRRPVRAALPSAVMAMLDAPLPGMIGFRSPPPWLRVAVRGALRARGHLIRLFPSRANAYTPKPRSYPHGWTVDRLGPQY